MHPCLRAQARISFSPMNISDRRKLARRLVTKVRKSTDTVAETAVDAALFKVESETFKLIAMFLRAYEKREDVDEVLASLARLCERHSTDPDWSEKMLAELDESRVEEPTDIEQ
jgi:hypothetical protein